MSNRSKGMYYEHKAQEELIKDGWLTQRAPPPNRFSKQTDLFGLFDLVAIKQNNILDNKFVQVKTNSKPNLTLFKEFKSKFPSANVEVWVFWQRGKRKSKKGWEKIIIEESSQL